MLPVMNIETKSTIRNGGSMYWTVEERIDGSRVKTPKTLHNLEFRILLLASIRYLEDPTSFVSTVELVRDLGDPRIARERSCVYRLIRRLEGWGYLSTHLEPLDATNGRAMNRRFLALTEAGFNRIRKEIPVR